VEGGREGGDCQLSSVYTIENRTQYSIILFIGCHQQLIKVRSVKVRSDQIRLG
jgi:hypothetical protein